MQRGGFSSSSSSAGSIVVGMGPVMMVVVVVVVGIRVPVDDVTWAVLVVGLRCVVRFVVPVWERRYPPPPHFFVVALVYIYSVPPLVVGFFLW